MTTTHTESAKAGPTTLYRQALREKQKVVQALTQLARDAIKAETERDKYRVALIEIGREVVPNPSEHARKALGVKGFPVSESVEEKKAA